MVTRVLIAAVLACIAAGCNTKSKLYCTKAEHQSDFTNCPQNDAAVDAPPPCTSDMSCPAVAPHCDLEGATQGLCVECLTDPDCAGNAIKKLCDPTMHTCQGCVKNSDCGSAACLPDGTCGDDATVIYVDEAGTDSGDCTFAAKCKTLAYGAGKLTATRKTIKLSGTVTNPSNLTLTSVHANLLGDPGTTVLTGGDPVLVIKTSDVGISNVRFTCGGNFAGFSPQMSTARLDHVTIHGCMKPALDAKGGYLSLTHSAILNNPGGGVRTDGSTAFSITNNFIHHNGSTGSAYGGINIGSMTTGSNVLQFNTIVENQVKAAVGGPAAGVACTIVNYMVVSNNIIGHNVDDNAASSNTSGTCDFSGSLTVDDIAPVNFVNAATSPYDYHLVTGSSAIDKAPGMTNVTDDIDGQFRPLGAGYDYGADEVKP